MHVTSVCSDWKEELAISVVCVRGIIPCVHMFCKGAPEFLADAEAIAVEPIK